MRFLHFSTRDTGGGAFAATYRHHTALREAGHTSLMIVGQKISEDVDVLEVPKQTLRYRIRQVRQKISQVRGTIPEFIFNRDIETEFDTSRFLAYPPGSIDLIYLHWVTNFLNVKDIHRIYEHYRCPIAWMMMDMEPFTGGCHYSLGCKGYLERCGNCPQLKSGREHDRSRIVWLRKNKYLSSIPIFFVTPSSWITARVQESSLFRRHRTQNIPVAIDTTIFRPFDQRVARDLLHVPPDKKVIFFGSTHLEQPRKGMAHMAEALRLLSASLDGGDSSLRKDDLFLLQAGSTTREFSESLPFPSKFLGLLKDELTLALAYQAADVFVCPSIEDSGPMMIPESMLCGTPVVAFDTGGAPDLIETMKTGYLAAHGDSADLAKGIEAVLSSGDIQKMRDDCRRIARDMHEPDRVVQRHVELCRSLVER
jgi:glycosyltransferase involved in cell wall biosynthesis